MQSPQYKILKLCVLGDLGVGKTSLTSRFVTENFVSKYKPTYQACHFHKYLQTPDDQVYIQIWDTSGTERFRSMSPHILRDSNGALLVYDVTNMASLISLNEYWLQWVANIVPEHFRIVVVGNKADLGQHRQVDIKMGRQFAAQNELLFYETSAMTGANVEVVFLDVVNLLADTLDESFSDSVELHKIQAKNSRCCAL